VPTTSGTGSEVTPIAVLDDPEAGTKAPVAGPALYPAHALVDP
jgi:acetaldehyde dehydrogenase/alcohol dehydrogenase